MFENIGDSAWFHIFFNFKITTDSDKKEDENQESEFPEPVIREKTEEKSELDTSDDMNVLRMLKMKRNESRKLNHAEVFRLLR